jgi:hypothetical protein
MDSINPGTLLSTTDVAKERLLTKALQKLNPNISIGEPSALARVLLILYVLSIWLLVYILLGMAPKKYNFKYPPYAIAIIVLSSIAQFIGFVLITMSDIFELGIIAKSIGFLLIIGVISTHVYLIYESVNNGAVFDKPYVNVALTGSITLSLSAMMFSFYI